MNTISKSIMVSTLQVNEAKGPALAYETNRAQMDVMLSWIYEGKPDGIFYIDVHFVPNSVDSGA